MILFLLYHFLSTGTNNFSPGKYGQTSFRFFIPGCIFFDGFPLQFSRSFVYSSMQAEPPPQCDNLPKRRPGSPPGRRFFVRNRQHRNVYEKPMQAGRC